MDIVLRLADQYLLEPYLYAHIDHPYARQETLVRNAFGIWFIMSFGGALMYLSFSALSYLLIFNKELEKDKRVRPFTPTLVCALESDHLLPDTNTLCDVIFCIHSNTP
jgi:hypothetical protein